ncbi:MAG TPA: class I SAM-dependent methyltransferase [Smithellaceae bacterium]|nr:class I SAM-dependent methyltransferase [Smithellaceae bacterium]
MSNRWRQFIKSIHPEGIPWPASIFYNALSGTNIFLSHYELVAADVAHFGKAARLLDIGTGPGHLLAAMRKVMPDTQLTGVDISAAMIAQAKRNMEKYEQDSHIELRVADAAALPFPDATFDRVVSTGSFHHWKNQLGALAEMYRVLKDDGCALIYDLVRDIPETVLQEVLAKYGGFRLLLLWLHSFEEPFLNAPEMEQLGRQTKFAGVETKFAGALCCLILRKHSEVNK